VKNECSFIAKKWHSFIKLCHFWHLLGKEDGDLRRSIILPEWINDFF